MGRRVGRLSAQLWGDGTGSAPWKCRTRGVSSVKKPRLKSGLKAHTWPSSGPQVSPGTVPSVPAISAQLGLCQGFIRAVQLDSGGDW